VCGVPRRQSGACHPAVCAFPAALAQCGDPFDSLLCVALMPGGEYFGSTNGSDGVPSPFWQTTAFPDSLLLAPPAHCREQPCGIADTNDASVRVLAIAGRTFFRLLVLVRDDHWQPMNVADRRGDLLEITLDPQSPSIIDTCTQCRFSDSALTFRSLALALWAGSLDGTDHRVELGKYDSQIWQWHSGLVDAGVLETQWGIVVEPIVVPQNVRGIELRMPWALLQMYEWELSNQTMFLSVAYYDRDSGADSGSLSLRERLPGEAGGSPAESWGPMLLPDSLSWCPYPEPWACGGLASTARPAGRRAPVARPEPAMLINGRRVPAPYARKRRLASCVVASGLPAVLSP